jgi:hypothetical protein
MRRVTIPGRLAILALAGTLGCGVHHQQWDVTPTPVAGLPEQLFGDSATGAVIPTHGCRGRLHDAQGRTELILVRSVQRGIALYWGDYEVAPAGAYGIRPGQLLRVDCGTGHPLGTVPRDG